MKRIILNLFTVMLIIIGFVIPSTSYAQGEYVSYSVRTLLPENQIENDHSYFNLRVEPNDIQQLQTEIFNHEDRDIIVNLSVRNSSTNQNGVIVYEEMEAKQDDHVIQLTEVLSFEEEKVIIPAGESKIVSATLEMQDEQFDGVILGGLHFEKELSDDKTSDGVNIQNKFAYLIGVVLSQDERVVPVDFQLKEIKADLINHRTAKVITIENNSPNIIEGLTIHTKIFQDGGKQPIKEKSQEQLNMAPYSTIDFVVDWDKQKIEPGDYLVKVEAKYKAEVWNWEETFTIEEKEANELNAEAIELEHNQNFQLNGFVLTSTIVFIIIIIGLLIYIRKLKRSVE